MTDQTDQTDQTGPADTRQDPPLSGDEVSQLYAFLDYQRATLLMKTADLSAEQLAQAHPPSTMTLGGLLKHLALVEDYWFCDVFAGKEEAEIFQGVDWDTDPDWEWHSAAQDTPEQLRTLLEETMARSRSVVAGVDLDTRAVRPDRRTGEHGTLRWIVLHMIEEYARHNGHADLVRESVDGLTGE